jgi:hypothetical protein
MVTSKTAFSVLHPMYEKVSKTIQSCETLEQFNGSVNMVEGFLSYIESQEDVGEFPKGYSRAILSTYYGSALREALINHPLFKH